MKKNKPAVRIGYGYDVHQLLENRKLVIGGVNIPFEKGLLGHSDADILIHAIVDAIMGALSLGDIGTHFPDTDDQFKNIDSRILLRKARELMHDAGYEIGNIDATIVAERPKMKPFIGKMQTVLSMDLNTAPEQISVKATTSEKMGFVGREEGLSATAVALLNIRT
ncbi:MAG: 2-C-methyl-D-erythritol 2,4-cyclodiphosphate synthase [Balneolales bacterium]|nr:2-C-methyl-D-erythritol 2,4-cyclodiphosphate synthase [Balneolales bacterium]